jgi:dsRNA-specific ribonuclease
MNIAKYFPERYDTKIHAMPNRNYPYNNLDMLKTAEECDKITDILSSMVPKDQKPIDVFVTNPQFGEQIISFLSHPSFNHVYTYQSDSDLMPYLQANLQLYGIVNRCTIEKGFFKGITSRHKNSVLYMDLSWVPRSWVQNDDITSFKIGQKTVSYWIEASKSVSLSVLSVHQPMKFRVPSGFAPSIDQDLDTKTFYMIPTTRNDIEKERQMFIYNFLKNIISNDKERAKYVTPKNMKIWNDAFTHESLDRNNNYEDMEKIGDAMLKLYFTQYLLKKDPSLDKAELTYLVNWYLSENYLPTLSRKYNFVKYIESKVPLRPKFFEDVFESFFGALFEVSENIQKDNGYIVGRNMAYHIFDEIDLDLSDTGPKETDPKSFILQNIFQKIKIPVPQEVDEKRDNRVDMNIVISPDAWYFFDERGIRLPTNYIIGHGSGITKDIARKNAWRVARENLEKRGITKQYINQVAEKLNFAHLELYDAVRKKYTDEGFKGIKLGTDIDTRGTFYQLLATKDLKNYNNILVENFATGSDRDNEVLILFRDYLAI